MKDAEEGSISSKDFAYNWIVFYRRLCDNSRSFMCQDYVSVEFTKVVSLLCRARRRGRATREGEQLNDTIRRKKMCDTIVLISGPALTTISFLLWTIVFGFLACALWSRKYERYLEVANWITSTLHAIVTTAVGILIVKNTRHDLIYAKCALTGTFPLDKFVLEDWSLTLYKRNHPSTAETFTFPHPEVFFLILHPFSRTSCIRIGRIFWTRLHRSFFSSVAEKFKGSQECRQKGWHYCATAKKK